MSFYSIYFRHIRTRALVVPLAAALIATALSITTDANAQDLLTAADVESSVRFDLTASVLETAPNLVPSSGTGDFISDISLSAEAEDSIESARAMYAPYELPPAVAPDNFIPKSVFLPDDRVHIPDTTAPWARAIVQILFKSPNGGSDFICSGGMISPDTVLTAAHCLHEGTVSGAFYRDFIVIPGRNGEAAPFGECQGTRLYVLTKWVTALTDQDSREFDLGALKLDCTIGETTGWFGVRALADEEVGTAITVQGYAGDKAPFGVQWSSPGDIKILWTLKAFHQNDTFRGTSGAPVYANADPSFIIGIHTNGRHGEEPWASNNAFTRITPEFMLLISNWIDGQ